MARARKFPDYTRVRPPVTNRPELADPGPIPLKGKPRARGGTAQKWNPDFLGIIVQLYSRGWSFTKIAQLIGVAPHTLLWWREKEPELKRFCDEAKEDWRKYADDRVVRSLYERATGYSYQDEDIKVIDGQVVRVIVVRHVPPDVKAAEIWLLNRRSGEWRARQEVVYSSSDDPRQLTDEELMRIASSGAKQVVLPPPAKSGNGSTH